MCVYPRCAGTLTVRVVLVARLVEADGSWQLVAGETHRGWAVLPSCSLRFLKLLYFLQMLITASSCCVECSVVRGDFVFLLTTSLCMMASVPFFFLSSEGHRFDQPLATWSGVRAGSCAAGMLGSGSTKLVCPLLASRR